MTLVRGWFHVKRYIYEKILKEVLEDYVAQITHLGDTLNISVVDMPKSVYFQINRLMDAQGLIEYEDQRESTETIKEATTS